MKMENKQYQSPRIEVVEVVQSEVLCASPSNVPTETDPEWNLF